MISLSKAILKNINVINIILILVLVLFLFKVVLPAYRSDITPIPPVTDKSVSEDTRIEEPSKKELPQPSDYSVIAENNLFHPDRKLVISKGEDQPVQKPDFVLYGTLITGDVKVAYIEDIKSPYTSQGRGKRQRALHIGEELSGYTVSEIYNEKIVMVRGDEIIEVRVIDSSKQRHQKIVTPSKPQKPEELKKQKAVKQEP